MTAAPEKFTKKPVQIEAIQLTPLSIDAVEEFVGGDAGRCPEHPACLVIATLEGAMHGSMNDWIIKGIKGEFYPCKPNIFADSYDRVVGENDYARIYTDDAGEWRYQAFAGNHRLIGSSEDGKATRQGVLRELKREYPHIGNISEGRKG